MTPLELDEILVEGRLPGQKLRNKISDPGKFFWLRYRRLDFLFGTFTDFPPVFWVFLTTDPILL
jgi:hypothetical protein